jgi:hypothetical protein
MSNRTLVELNHDFCPHGDEELMRWAVAMRTYMTSADKKFLPDGVTFKHFRHHSEPDPLERASASGEQGPDEKAWLLEREANGTIEYIGVINGMFGWTPDSLKALRLTRRADADALCEIIEDCWRVAEHMWCAPLGPTSNREGR